MRVGRRADPVRIVAESAKLLAAGKEGELPGLHDALVALRRAAGSRLITLGGMDPRLARRILDGYAKALTTGRPAKKLVDVQSRELEERARAWAMMLGAAAMRVVRSERKASVTTDARPGSKPHRGVTTELVLGDLKKTNPNVSEEILSGDAMDEVAIFYSRSSLREVARLATERGKSQVEADRAAGEMISLREAAQQGPRELKRFLGLTSARTRRRNKARQRLENAPRKRPHKSRG